jgi:sugar lactone lactonase YvrE
METKTTILADNLKFPEGPRWHDGKLWCCDLLAQRVVHVDLQGDVQTVVELPDTPTSLGWTPEGQLLVVSLSVENGALVEVADLSELVLYPLNDMVIDRKGRAYIGNLGYDFGDYQATPMPAPLLLVTPEGSTRIVADGLAFPNGMVITPDERTLIVAESHGARLTAFDIEPDGSLSHGRIWAQFNGADATETPESQITPDDLSGCRRGCMGCFPEYERSAACSRRRYDYESYPS